MLHPLLTFLFTVFIVDPCGAQYSIPDVILQAYSPKGFKASIPDTPGINLFTFNGKLNGIIRNNEIGQINKEATTPEKGFWEITDPELQLMVGDKISYWVYVLYDRIGFTGKVVTWEINELQYLPKNIEECNDSVSVVSGGAKFCSGATILYDNFDTGFIDGSKWMVENYIPTYVEEPYEFVTYRNIDACRFIKSSILYLKPVFNYTSSLRSVIDLKKGCTRNSDQACYHKPRSLQVSPLISSGKITSKIAFKYGRIEVRAKLPTGDWIYPRMELVPNAVENDYTRLIIGYSRGNPRLVKDTEDIGSKVLLGGPILRVEARDTYLRKKSEYFSTSEKFHTYTAIWSPDNIELLVDNEVYGSVPTDSSAFAPFNNEFRLTLGVSVGGMRDFPDGYSSNGVQKPWINFEIKGMKTFFDDKTTWLQTWQGDNVALQIDWVKIIAL